MSLEEDVVTSLTLNSELLGAENKGQRTYGQSAQPRNVTSILVLLGTSWFSNTSQTNQDKRLTLCADTNGGPNLPIFLKLSPLPGSLRPTGHSSLIQPTPRLRFFAPRAEI